MSNVCNNCGQHGHVYHQCKHPITSIGVITYKIDENGIIKYLLICRKDSLGYIDFMRGKYKLNSKEYLENIFNEMTISEKEKILNSIQDNNKETFDSLWNKLWGEKIGMQYRGEERSSKEKYYILKDGVVVNNQEYNLSSLLNNTTTSWIEPEWGFPKGRRNYNEKDINCAVREFEEETGIMSENINIIQNLLPLNEIFTGSNYKTYKHSYYIAKLINNNYNFNPQISEVSDIKWMTYEEAMNKIRPYNLEKLNILKQVNKIITTYKII